MQTSKDMNTLKYLSFGLTGLLVLAMMTATILEKAYGTDFVLSQIYGSPFFVAAWTVVAVSSFIYLMRHRMPKKSFTFLLHFSFLVILAGALTTYLSAGREVCTYAPETPPYTTMSNRTCTWKPFPFR